MFWLQLNDHWCFFKMFVDFILKKVITFVWKKMRCWFVTFFQWCQLSFSTVPNYLISCLDISEVCLWVKYVVRHCFVFILTIGLHYEEFWGPKCSSTYLKQLRPRVDFLFKQGNGRKVHVKFIITRE